MDANRPTNHQLIEEPSADQSKPANAKRYVSYRSLLLRNAAVWYRQNRVFFSTAGANPAEHRLTCVSGSEARKLAARFATELRKARSDEQYNQVIVQFLAEIRSAWPDNVKVRHVHTCRTGVPGKVNAEGRCDCGFDWTIHEQTLECPCVVEIDNSDETGEWQFVVHRVSYQKKEQVSV